MLQEIIFILFLFNIIPEQFSETVSNTYEKINPVVTTENGKVRGRLDMTVGRGKPYYVFQGIPFAQPPVGNLRFEPPLPAKKWKGTLNTQKYNGDCIQGINGLFAGNFTGSEDCLYINVYTPKLKGNNLAVMVWIFGGGYYSGTSGPDLYGPDYLIDNDVIIVTFNYRLGVFGFLSTGDLVAPGNAGLKDQLLALKWIKKNIVKFGGNPNKITIFGESAGASSVAYHLTSTKSKGLFRNGIMESGSSICLWALSRKMKQAVTLLSNAFGLNVNNSQSLVKGLKKINAQALYDVSIDISQNLQGLMRQGLIFAPVVEPSHSGAFFTQKSHQLLLQKKFHSVPVILGFNSMESLLFWEIVQAFYLTNTTGKYDFVPVDLNIKKQTENDIVYNKIKEFYFGNEPVYTQLYQAHQFASTDLMVRPIVETAHLLSKKSKTYFYEFSYVGNLGEYSNYPVPGASHLDEIFYIFRKDSNQTSFTDALMRSRLTRLWTNFAKYSNPTPFEEPLLENIKWYESDIIKDNLLYLKLDKELELGLNPRNKYIKFWEKIYKEHGYPPFDTY